LEANGQRGHTVILVTSDHGELLGDHNRYGKSCFFEPVTRVPAILHHPELQQGFVFAGLIETFAVAATVLDLAGVPRPVEMTAPSLVPILRRDRAEGWPLALCEHVSNDRQWRAVCARTDRHKLALWHRTTGETAHELYDLAEDPLEQRNLYGDPARRAICEEMKDRLLARLLESGAPPYDSWLRTLPRKLREEE
jgi:arylsulfatase A-like enzyme